MIFGKKNLCLNLTCASVLQNTFVLSILMLTSFLFYDFCNKILKILVLLQVENHNS